MTLTARVTAPILVVAISAIAALDVALLERQPRSFRGKKALALACLRGLAGVGRRGNRDRVPGLPRASPRSWRRGLFHLDFRLE